MQFLLDRAYYEPVRISVNPEACYSGVFFAGFLSGILEFGLIALALNVLTFLFLRPMVRLKVYVFLLAILIVGVTCFDGWYPIGKSRILPAIIATGVYWLAMARASKKPRWGGTR